MTGAGEWIENLDKGWGQLGTTDVMNECDRQLVAASVNKMNLYWDQSVWFHGFVYQHTEIQEQESQKQKSFKNHNQVWLCMWYAHVCSLIHIWTDTQRGEEGMYFITGFNVITLGILFFSLGTFSDLMNYDVKRMYIFFFF